MPDFTYYPKTPRLSSGYIITEKRLARLEERFEGDYR